MTTSMRKNLKTLLTAVSLGLLSSVAMADEPQTEVELTHWWNQPGEVAALNEIKKAAFPSAMGLI